MGGVVIMTRYCASVSLCIHAAVRHGSHGSLDFVLVPLSSLSESCASAASKSFLR